MFNVHGVCQWQWLNAVHKIILQNYHNSDLDVY